MPQTNARFQAPLSVVRCQGRPIATYTSAAFISPRQLRRRPPLVVSLLVMLLCALALSLVCVLLIHPVNQTSFRATTQNDGSLPQLLDEYDP